MKTLMEADGQIVKRKNNLTMDPLNERIQNFVIG